MSAGSGSVAGLTDIPLAQAGPKFPYSLGPYSLGDEGGSPGIGPAPLGLKKKATPPTSNQTTLWPMGGDQRPQYLVRRAQQPATWTPLSGALVRRPTGEAPVQEGTFQPAGNETLKSNDPA